MAVAAVFPGAESTFLNGGSLGLGSGGVEPAKGAVPVLNRSLVVFAGVLLAFESGEEAFC